MRPFVVAACLVAFSGLPAAASTQELFVEGNLAYSKGHHQEAIEKYTTILNSEESFSSQGLAQLHYNLGNAYLREGKLGASIGSYLSSYAQDPGNEDLLANLEFARSNTKDALTPQETNPILRTLFFWHFSLGRKEAISLLLWGNALFWLLMGLQLFVQDNALLKWCQRFTLCSVLLLGTSVGLRWISPTQVAVVQESEISVYSGQDTASVVRFKLHEGSEVRAVQIEGNWVKVDLPEQKQGWVKAEDVRVVSL